MVRASDFGRKLCRHRLANTVVGHLDDFAAVAQPAPDEAMRTQQPDELVGPVVDLGRRRSNRDRNGSAFDRDHLEQASCILRQLPSALAHHLLERHGRQIHGSCRCVGGSRACETARELLDEKRATARLAGDGARDEPRSLLRSEQREGQPLGVVRRKRADVQLPHRDPLRHARPHRTQEVAVRRFVLPVAHDEQHSERRRTKQLEQQRGAVGIAPLCVVDIEDESPPRCR